MKRMVILLLMVTSFSCYADRFTADMLSFVYFMHEEGTFIDIIPFPEKSNITKQDIKRLKEKYSMYTELTGTFFEYKDVDNAACEKLTHKMYDVLAYKKGILTTLERTLIVRQRGNITAKNLGKKIGQVFITCKSSCDDTNFQGCLPDSISMESEYASK